MTNRTKAKLVVAYGLMLAVAGLATGLILNPVETLIVLATLAGALVVTCTILALVWALYALLD